MKRTWHNDVFFGLHFDIHALNEDPALGRDCDRAELVRQFRKVRPDFVQCDCKGHPGLASYPTKVGISAPHIVKDALREWRAATRELGIPLVMHYSGINDHEVLVQHPDWGHIAIPGNPRSDAGTCPTSPYLKEYMIPQLVEVLEEYDVDGFWVDAENWAVVPCYCDRCKAEFRRKTGIETVPTASDQPHWEQWLAFFRDLFEERTKAYCDAVHACKPSVTVCSNWMYTLREPSELQAPVDYLSGDFNPIWSVFTAMAEAKYMDTRGLDWDLMAWGFTSAMPWPSDQWVFKTADALCQEAGIVMANGGSLTIYDMPNTWGTLVDWHLDVEAEVARFCRERQSYCQGSTLVPQVGIYHNPDHYYRNNIPNFNLGYVLDPIYGALHAVCQTGRAASILSKGDLLRRVKEFPLWIIPEQSHITDDVRQAMLQYVAAGGRLIVSGESTRFFEHELGVEITGETPRGYHQADSPYAINRAKHLCVEVGTQTQPVGNNFMAVRNISAEVEKPLLGSRDAGEHRILTGFAAASIKNYGKGKIAGIYGPIYREYYKNHYHLLRKFLDQFMTELEPQGLVHATASPNLNLSVRTKDGKLLVHMVNLSCDPITTPESPCIETVPSIGPVTIEVPLNARPSAAYVMPGAKAIRWTYENARLKVLIPSVGIHDTLIVETEDPAARRK